MRRSMIYAGTFLAALAWSAGCSMLYNGALTSPPNSNVRVVAAPGYRATPPTTRRAPERPDRMAMTAKTDPAPSAAADPAPMPTQGAGVRFTVGPVGLWGSIPQTDRPQASPMDSPDNLRRISFASEGADFDPKVDPTGKYLVYASTQHRLSSDLYLKRVDGTAVTQLTNDPANDVMPTFSPDGKRIAFASDRSGNWDIYIMEVDGGQPVQLTQDPSHEIHPSFSPDGKQIVFCSLGAQSGQWELVVMDTDNPAVRRFIGFGLFPEWSPTDDKIVFQRARERGTRWFSIWTIDLVNGEGIRPTEIAASANAAAITPTWSPDGRYIAFCTVLDPDADADTVPGQADVWIIGASGSGRANLTHSRFADVQPAWSPDGSIYFVSNRAKNARESVWSVRPDRALKVVEAGGAAEGPQTANAIE